MLCFAELGMQMWYDTELMEASERLKAKPESTLAGLMSLCRMPAA